MNEIERVRAILAGTDANSLPRDVTTEQIAQARMDDIAALREAIQINNQEALNWKARLLDKIARLEAALREYEPAQ